MGKLTVVIPDELERKLRLMLPLKKGALSDFIVKAIKEKLERIEGGE